MRYGLDITPAGAWGRPDQIAELAALAEAHGWDGVFCEDYLAFPGGLPTYDVWATLALVAQATTRVVLGTLVTPLPARHPPTLALQARTVAALSGGRVVLGVGSGDPLGDPALTEAVSRSDLTEAALATIREAAPSVPIWVGGAVTKRRPRARALRWDGACLYRVPPPDWEDLTPDDVAALREDAARESFVIAVGGRQRRSDLAGERRYVAALADAGADWWHEYLPPRLTAEEARRRILDGPVAP
ncbi:LLM class F420-dependent oxidoreductase [Nocardioides marinquilinus]|uniref:LLM class F420-dependent oxidoreductase n=1 Tax=Nocardioides marinquilinus TaxID=1210400 RepID=A0ABP9PU33_9ACTN